MASKKSQEKAVSRLLRRLDKVEEELKKISIIISTTNETSNIFWSRLRNKTSKIYEKARKIYADWNKLEVPKFYKDYVLDQIKRVKSISYKPKITLNYNSFIKKDIHRRNIANILNDSLTSFITGTEMGNRKFNRLLGATQQLNVTEKQLNQAIKDGFDERKSIYGARKKVQQALLKDSLDAKYITIINKNGKPMNYNIKSYADLVVRTQLRNAQSDAVLSTSLGYDNDLLQVSSHNTQTLICQEFEGKVFSISGKDDRFPPLTEMSPFHINCLHTMSVYFADAHTEGQLENISDFSLGKTEVHPTRKSFIPVSERGK